MLQQNQKKNPATAFLTMAGFNIVGAIAFVVFYFLHKGADGESSYYLLIAAGIAALSSGGCLVAYSIFKKKFENIEGR